MAATVNTKCPCGFEVSNIVIGGGRSNFQYYCSFPVYCRSCRRMSASNLLAGVVHPPAPKRSLLTLLKDLPGYCSRRRRPPPSFKDRPRCGHCGGADVVSYDSDDLVRDRFYDVEGLQVGLAACEIEPRQVEKWNVKDRLGRDLILTDRNYFCPQCGTFAMTFERGSLVID